MWDRSCRESRKSEFQIDCASRVSFVLQSKLHELKIHDKFLEMHSVRNQLRNAFYSATDDTIKMIGRISVDIRSKGWLAKKLKLLITEGGQRVIIGNNAFPQLCIEVRQKLLSGSFNEVEMQGDCLVKQYSTIKHNFVYLILHRFKNLFKSIGMLKNC